MSLVRYHADAVDFQHQIVPDAAYLIALAELHHALMLSGKHLQRNHCALYQLASAGYRPHIVRLLLGLYGILRRVEPAAPCARASLRPRPLLRYRAYLLPTDSCTLLFHACKDKKCPPKQADIPPCCDMEIRG